MIALPSKSFKLNLKKTESVSPYTYSALVFTSPWFIVSMIWSAYASSTTLLA